MTYGDLDERARGIAATIQERLPLGARVLLLLPWGPEYVYSLLGCIYAGVAAVPCYPLESGGIGLKRLTAIVSDSEAAAAMVAEGTLAKDLTSNVDLLLINVQLIANEKSALWRPPAVDQGSVALVQYTSGSTHVPRGVVLTHGNLLANERMIQEVFEQNESSVVVGWLPLYHDMGLIGNVLQPLYSGSCGVLMSPEAFLHRPMRWPEAISRYGATTSGGPDFAYRLCVENFDARIAKSLDLRAWRVAFNGAEPVRATTIERFAEVFGGSGFSVSAFVPCYGLAEATLFVSAQKSSLLRVSVFESEKLQRNVASAVKSEAHGTGRRLVSCGAPVTSQEVAIVDPEALIRRGANEVGEIWVSGPNVSRSYFNRPELTQQTLNARMNGDDRAYLRTGDLGFMHEGHLYVTGRLKDLIIIRGENHHPEDIEFTIAENCPNLANCRAAVFITDSESEWLVVVQEVYTHQKSGFEGIAASIRQAVLKEHGVRVDRIVFVRRGGVPRTSSGKIQRHICRSKFMSGKLRAIATDELSRNVPEPWAITRSINAAPASRDAGSLETYLSAEISRLNGVRSDLIGLDQPIGSLGLDSLSTAILKSRLEEHFKAPIPLSTFLDAPSLRVLAREISAILARLQERKESSPRLAGRTSGPLSPEQERIWLFEQLHKRTGCYNLSAVVRIREDLNRDRFRLAAEQLLQRHGALRTVFPSTADGPIQQVLAHQEVKMEFLPGGRFRTEQEKDVAVRQALEYEEAVGFDLERGPVVRFRAFPVDNEEYALIVTTHHIVADAWSLQIMCRELAAIYRAMSGESVADLPQSELEYLDVAQLQHDRVQDTLASMDYWRTQFLEPSYQLRWPRNRFSGELSSARASFTIPSELTAVLQQRSRETGITLFSYLLTGFTLLLGKWIRKSDIAVGVPVWGRGVVGTVNLVGLFAHPLLLRIAFDSRTSVGEMLTRVHENILDALRHQDVPFSQLFRLVAPDHRDRLFRIPVLFSMLPDFDKSDLAREDRWNIESIQGGDQDVEFLLTLEQREGDITGQLRFDTGILKSNQAPTLIAGYVRCLEFLLSSGTTLEDLRIELPPAPVPADETKHDVRIVSTFTAEPLNEVFQFWENQLGTNLNASFAPYGQLFQELMVAPNETQSGRRGTKILIVRLSDLTAGQSGEGGQTRDRHHGENRATETGSCDTIFD